MPSSHPGRQVCTIELPVRELTRPAFAAFGTVIASVEDGVPFGPQDARLDLSQGTPRFYNMRLPGRGLCFDRITRHRAVTQALASVGGFAWLLAVAPPSALHDANAEPRPQDIQAFRIPGDVAVMLHAGTWHAGPLFAAAEMSFFNLELADTNITEWAQLAEEGMFLAAPDALLDAWREAYEAPPGQRQVFYTTLHGASFDAVLMDQLPEGNVQIALASFSAAQWLAPFGRTGTHYFYADAEGLEILRSRLKLSSDSKSENVVVTVLDDPGLFRDTVQPASGVVCTSPVQKYLDLAAAGERGQEGANHLRQEKLHWQE